MSKRGRSPVAFLLLGGVGLVVSACYQVAPQVPEDFSRRPRSDGLAPIAVYTEDPAHPANRWFQRAFSERDRDGRFVAPRTDAPYVPRHAYQPVDRAEILALLEVVGRHGLAASPVSQTLLETDLFAESERLRASDNELAQAYADAARGVSAARVEDSPGLAPPPLRDGLWLEVAGSLAPGLRATPADFREGRIYYGFDSTSSGLGGPRPVTELPAPRRAALVRYRVALDGEGIRATPVASEAWVLERARSAAGEGDSLLSRVFRFDRAAWWRGGEPWRELPAAESLRIRNPVEPAGAALEGDSRALCVSCHSGKTPFLSYRQGFRLVP